MWIWVPFSLLELSDIVLLSASLLKLLKLGDIYYLTICLPVGAEMIIVGILHSEDQKKLHPLIISNSNSMMKGQCPYMTIVNLFVSS